MFEIKITFSRTNKVIVLIVNESNNIEFSLYIGYHAELYLLVYEK